MKKILFILVLFVCSGLSAQQYFFNGTVHVPKTTAEINAISSPVEGRQEANSDTGTIWYYNGSAWIDTGEISIADGSITEAKLSTSVNASLDLADSALQSGDNVSELVNDAGYITEGGNLIPVTQAEYDLLTPTEIEENDYAIVDEDDGSWSGGDNLGNHTATQDLDLSNFNVINADTIAPTTVLDILGSTRIFNGMLTVSGTIDAGLSVEGKYLTTTDGELLFFGSPTLSGTGVTGANRMAISSDNKRIISKRGSGIELIEDFDALTADRTITYPDSSGEIALKSSDSGTTGLVLEGLTSGTYTTSAQSWNWSRSGDIVHFRINLSSVDGTTPTGTFLVDLSATSFPEMDVNSFYHVATTNFPLNFYSIFGSVHSVSAISISIQDANDGSNTNPLSDVDFTGITTITITGTYITND